MLAQQIFNGLVSGSINVLFALGFTLVFGINNILNLAHGSVFTWGAFIALYLVTGYGVPFPLAALIAAVGTGLLMVLIDIVAFRPLRRRGAQEFSAIVSSIGVSLVLTSIAQQVSNTRTMRFPFDTFPVVIFHIMGVNIQLLQLVILATIALCVVLLLATLYKTRIGRQIRAVAISERVAMLLGINSTRVLSTVFFMSGVLAGVAGILVGLSFNTVHFLMGEGFLLQAFVVVVLGGLGSIAGAVVAGLLLGVLQSLSIAYLSAGVTELIMFSALFAALILRPTGLFGAQSAAARVGRQ